MKKNQNQSTCVSINQLQDGAAQQFQLKTSAAMLHICGMCHLQHLKTCQKVRHTCLWVHDLLIKSLSRGSCLQQAFTNSFAPDDITTTAASLFPSTRSARSCKAHLVCCGDCRSKRPTNTGSAPDTSHIHSDVECVWS